MHVSLAPGGSSNTKGLGEDALASRGLLAWPFDAFIEKAAVEAGAVVVVDVTDLPPGLG